MPLLRLGLPTHPRRAVGSVGFVALTAALTMARLGLVAALIIILGVAVLLARRPSVVANLPTALVLVLAIETVLAQVAGASGVRLFSSQGYCRAVLIGGGVLVGYALYRLPAGRVLTFACRGERLAFIPAALLGAYGLTQLFLPLPRAVSWFFRGGDNIQHLLLAAEVEQTGGLSYRNNPYPRAWHSFVALLAGATGPAVPPSPVMFTVLLGTMAAATWGLYVCLASAVSTLALELARRVGTGPRGVALAGMGAGATMLLPPFFAGSVGYGFQTSVVLVLAIAVALIEVVRDTSPARGFVVCTVVLTLTANTWQAAMPLALVPWGFAAWRHADGLRRGHMISPRGAIAISTLLVAAFSAAPAMVAAVSVVGLGHLAAAGEIGVIPWPFLALTFAGAGMTLCWRAWRSVASVVGLTVLTSAALALLAAAKVGVPLSSYYPSKLLWYAVALGVAPAWAVAVSLLGRFARTMSSLSVMPALASCVVLAAPATVIGAGLFSPLPAVAGTWPSADPTAIVRAIVAPGSVRAQVAWRVGRSPVDDTFVELLLDYRRVGDNVRHLPKGVTHDEECARLRDSHRPVVVTLASQAAVRDQFACAPGTQAYVLP